MEVEREFEFDSSVGMVQFALVGWSFNPSS